MSALHETRAVTGRRRLAAAGGAEGAAATAGAEKLLAALQTVAGRVRALGGGEGGAAAAAMEVDGEGRVDGLEELQQVAKEVLAAA